MRDGIVDLSHRMTSGIPQRYAECMTVQVAVKLPDELLASLDELVRDGTFASRSEAVRAGAEAVVAARRRADLELRYAAALERAPETAEEIAEAERLAIEAINDEPWERWW